jgi:hypothetical protein
VSRLSNVELLEKLTVLVALRGGAVARVAIARIESRIAYDTAMSVHRETVTARGSL